jgi:hypothetical protein
VGPHGLRSTQNTEELFAALITVNNGHGVDDFGLNVLKMSSETDGVSSASH